MVTKGFNMIILWGFYEKGCHTNLLHEKGCLVFFITKRDANGHPFHEKGCQKALWRLTGQYISGGADN